VFSDLLQHDEHVGSRCLDNPKVVRRIVAKRGVSHHDPYRKMETGERLELLEKGLLQFPRNVIEEIVMTGRREDHGCSGGAFLYDLETQKKWIADRLATCTIIKK